MVPYDLFAKFYDAIMGDRQHSFERVISLIEQYRPEAKTVLELGAGTGSVLKGLSAHYQVQGIELSPEMLAIAKVKVPEAGLHLGDMSDFSLEKSFDVVVCVYDTINHLRALSEWKKVFERASAHLYKDGLFIFDINTFGRLDEVVAGPPAVREFEGGRMDMVVRKFSDSEYDWDIKLTENLADGTKHEYQEHIIEAAFPIKDILMNFAEYFEVKEVVDIDGKEPSDDSRRIFFVGQKR